MLQLGSIGDTPFGLTSQGIGAIGTGIGDFFEAGAYDQAAGIERHNAEIQGLVTSVQQAQENRAIFQTEGSQQAQIGASGLKQSGSALSILASTAQQGSLQKQAIGLQGYLKQQEYLQQADAYSGQASAATAQGAGNILGGIASMFGI